MDSILERQNIVKFRHKPVLCGGKGVVGDECVLGGSVRVVAETLAKDSGGQDSDV